MDRSGVFKVDPRNRRVVEDVTEEQESPHERRMRTMHDIVDNVVAPGLLMGIGAWFCYMLMGM